MSHTVAANHISACGFYKMPEDCAAAADSGALPVPTIHLPMSTCGRLPAAHLLRALFLAAALGSHQGAQAHGVHACAAAARMAWSAGTSSVSMMQHRRCWYTALYCSAAKAPMRPALVRMPEVSLYVTDKLTDCGMAHCNCATHGLARRALS